MTTPTDAERAGIEQFAATIPAATDLQLALGLAPLLPGGEAERMPGAPSRAALDAMAELIRAEQRCRAGEPATVAETPTVTPAARTTPAGYTRVRIVATGRSFGKAVDKAKRVRGRYEPATKTWLIPANADELKSPSGYGWQVVGA